MAKREKGVAANDEADRFVAIRLRRNGETFCMTADGKIDLYYLAEQSAGLMNNCGRYRLSDLCFYFSGSQFIFEREYRVFEVAAEKVSYVNAAMELDLSENTLRIKDRGGVNDYSLYDLSAAYKQARKDCGRSEEKCRELFQNNLMCQETQQQEQNVPLMPNM